MNYIDKNNLDKNKDHLQIDCILKIKLENILKMKLKKIKK